MTGRTIQPDGEWIYFNSSRTGRMQIWRIRPDGSDVQHVTDSDITATGSPHPSPDGKHRAGHFL